MIKTLNNIETIIVHCPNWVGDIVMATPTLDCLREALGEVNMICLMKRAMHGILKDGPWFNSFIDCGDKSWSALRHTAKQIRRLKPDVAIVLPNSLRSALLARLGGVKEIYGYSRNFRGILLKGGPGANHSKNIVPGPMTEYYLEICRWLGLKVPDRIKPRLFVGDQVLEKANVLIRKYDISDSERVIGLNPGASFGSSKCWPPEYFARVARLCQEKLNARVILFTGPGEEDIAQKISSKAENIIDTTCDRLDLELLKPLVRRCDLLITNDTGPRHYAVAFDVPVVVIMGPTDPRYTCSNLEHTIVIRKELDCSPCHKKVCPREHRCMREITPAEVFAATEELLSRYI